MKDADLQISPTKARLLLEYDAARQLGMSEREWAIAHLKNELADPESVINKFIQARQRLILALDGLDASFRSLASAFKECEVLEREESLSTNEAIKYMFLDLPGEDDLRTQTVKGSFDLES